MNYRMAGFSSPGISQVGVPCCDATIANEYIAGEDAQRR